LFEAPNDAVGLPGPSGPSLKKSREERRKGEGFFKNLLLPLGRSRTDLTGPEDRFVLWVWI